MLNTPHPTIRPPAVAPPLPRARAPAVVLLAVLLSPLAATVVQAASLVDLAQDIQAAVGHAGAALAASAPPAHPRLAAPSTVHIGAVTFFAANDAAHGRELWQSDGTLGGTHLVSDINPGAGDSSPSDLTNFNGSLFFAADDGVHGTELWKSDGTPAGTTLVADINPAAAEANTRSGPAVGAGVSHLTVVGANLFFTANDGTHGNELWVYAGATARLVKDINSGAGGSGPDWLTNVNGNLLFAADDGTHGFQLWKSDGTPVNTTMVQVINPGGNAYPFWLSPIRTRLHFFADDGAHGAELWQSTRSPASRVKNLHPGDGSNPLWLTAAGNALFFSADHGTLGWKLWKRTGTTGGTVTDLVSGASDWPPLRITSKETPHAWLT